MRRSRASMTSLTSKPHSSSLSLGSVQRTAKTSTRQKITLQVYIKVCVRCVQNQGAGSANKKFHLFHYGDDSYQFDQQKPVGRERAKKNGNGSSRSAIISQTHIVRACGYFSELKFIDLQARTHSQGAAQIEQKNHYPAAVGVEFARCSKMQFADQRVQFWNKCECALEFPCAIYLFIII